MESNTAALVDDSRNPTLSRNLQGWKKEFINLSAEEMATQSKIWSFSGIVEYETGLDGSATGWTVRNPGELPSFLFGCFGSRPDVSGVLRD